MTETDYSKLLENDMFLTDNPIVRDSALWDYIYEKYLFGAENGPSGSIYFIKIPYEKITRLYRATPIESGAVKFWEIAA